MKKIFLYYLFKKRLNLPLFSSKKYGTTPTKFVMFTIFTSAEEFIRCNDAVKGNFTLTKSPSLKPLLLSFISE